MITTEESCEGGRGRERERCGRAVPSTVEVKELEDSGEVGVHAQDAIAISVSMLEEENGGHGVAELERLPLGDKLRPGYLVVTWRS